MRFKITFNRISKRNFLPFSYQYFISSLIYKRIAEADAPFADFLHQQGYGEGNRKFKLFCFSPLDVRPFRVHKKRGVLELLGQTISLQVGFFLPQAAENFIKGLFMHQQVGLGDKINQVDFEVSSIEAVAAPLFSYSMQYKALAPICISRPPKGTEQHAQYLQPHHNEYSRYLINNIIQKWIATRGSVPYGEPAGNGLMSMPHEALTQESEIQFKCLTSEPKSQMITIKPFTPEQTKVRGFLYDFELTAPQGIHELIYAAGLGEKCSMGFGMVDTKNF